MVGNGTQRKSWSGRHRPQRFLFQLRQRAEPPHEFHDRAPYVAGLEASQGNRNKASNFWRIFRKYVQCLKELQCIVTWKLYRFNQGLIVILIQTSTRILKDRLRIEKTQRDKRLVRWYKQPEPYIWIKIDLLSKFKCYDIMIWLNYFSIFQQAEVDNFRSLAAERQQLCLGIKAGTRAFGFHRRARPCRAAKRKGWWAVDGARLTTWHKDFVEPSQ